MGHFINAHLRNVATIYETRVLHVEHSSFTLTSRGLSVPADCTPQYVSKLAMERLIPFITASNGMRLFPEGAAEIVRRIKAERIARRGWKRAA
jgi:hypothetical protein